MQHATQIIRESLLKAKDRMRKYANRRRKEREFEEGDMVYLRIQPYRHTSLSLHRSLKLHSKYYGPYRVLKRIGEVAYRLLLPPGTQLHPVFHVSQLKKHIGAKVVPSPNLPLVDGEGNIKVAPEVILARRVIPRNNEPVAQWQIKWVNLPAEAASWEDVTFI
jgi:ribosomal protein L21E